MATFVEEAEEKHTQRVQSLIDSNASNIVLPIDSKQVITNFYKIHNMIPDENHLNNLHGALGIIDLNVPVKILDTILRTNDVVRTHKDQTSLKDMASIRVGIERDYPEPEKQETTE